MSTARRPLSPTKPKTPGMVRNQRTTANERK